MTHSKRCMAFLVVMFMTSCGGQTPSASLDTGATDTGQTDADNGSCTWNGVVYQVTESWKDDCNDCWCQLGMGICTGRYCGDGWGAVVDAGTDTEVLDAEVLDISGPRFYCGTTTCNGALQQVCVHPCCGGPAPECMPKPENGVCPTDSIECMQEDGTAGCETTCTPDPPYCADAAPEPRQKAVRCTWRAYTLTHIVPALELEWPGLSEQASALQQRLDLGLSALEALVEHHGVFASALLEQLAESARGLGVEEAFFLEGGEGVGVEHR